jgi:hypothetical protein
VVTLGSVVRSPLGVASKDASYGSCQLLRKFVRLLVLTLISPTDVVKPPATQS